MDAETPCRLECPECGLAFTLTYEALKTIPAGTYIICSQCYNFCLALAWSAQGCLTEMDAKNDDYD